jgi:hypothetical protein
MCIDIDFAKSLSKRTVWKVFDHQGLNSGPIVSLYRGASYPKGEPVERSPGPVLAKDGQSANGLYFYVSKAIATREAKNFYCAYIAKFSVDPDDFLFASQCGKVAIYQRATRVGNYIRIT